MLSKKNRISKIDFKNVLKFGKAIYGESFTLFFFHNKNIKSPQFGVVAGLKAHKKATKRNKLKRRMRELLRLEATKLKNTVQIIAICKAGILQKKFPTLQNELQAVLSKWDLYNKNSLKKT